MTTRCELCNEDRPRTGPFRDDRAGKVWTAVCGRCKLRYTLADPRRLEKLKATIQAAWTAPILPTEKA